MAISDDSFNMDVGDIMEEAFEIAGTELRTGNDFKSGRRALNLMLTSWHNKGINLWTLDNQTIPLISGTATYDVDIDTISILDAVVREHPGSADQSDYTCPRLSFSTYADYPNKLQRARPLNFWFNRIGVRDATALGDRVPTVTMWPVPDTNNYSFVFWRMRKMKNAGNARNHLEISDRFLPAAVAGLAYNVALKKPELTGRVQLLEMHYEKLLADAMDEDRVKEDLRLVPDFTGYVL